MAKAAKVSPATVSKVFNPQGSKSIKISEETRQRVLEAAKLLDYTPSYGAKLLRSGKAQTIGFVVENDDKTEGFLGEYTVELLNGIRDEAAKKGYNILLINNYDYLMLFESGRIDALAIVGYNRDSNPNEARLLAAYDAMLKGGRPFATINGNYEDKGFPGVSIDNKMGIGQAVDLIVRKGYRRVGFLGDLGENIQSHHAVRLAHLKMLLAKNGLPVDPAYFLCGAASVEGGPFPRVGRYNHFDGYEGLRQLHAKGLGIDCLVCGTDSIAFGAMKYCLDNGISIPGRLALVGFDDVPSAELTNPPLTTVVQPLREMGRKTFAMLLDGIENSCVALRRETVRTRLAERASA